MALSECQQKINPAFSTSDLYLNYLEGTIDLCCHKSIYGFLITDDYPSLTDFENYLNQWQNQPQNLIASGGYFSLAMGFYGFSESVKKLLIGDLTEIYSRYAILMNETAIKTNAIFMLFETENSVFIDSPIKPCLISNDIIKGARITKHDLFIPKHQITKLCTLKNNTQLKDKPTPQALHHKKEVSYLKIINVLLKHGKCNTTKPFKLHKDLERFADTQDLDFVNKDTFKQILNDCAEYR